MPDTHAGRPFAPPTPECSRRRTEPGRRTPRYADRGSRRRGSSVQGSASGQFYVPRRDMPPRPSPLQVVDRPLAAPRTRSSSSSPPRQSVGHLGLDGSGGFDEQNLAVHLVELAGVCREGRAPRAGPFHSPEGIRPIPGSHAGGDETSSWWASPGQARRRPAWRWSPAPSAPAGLSGRPLGRRAVLAITYPVSFSRRSTPPRMTPHPESISIAQARRLALAGAGLLAPRRLGLPERAGVRSAQARERCHRIVEHFGLPADRHRRGERSTHPLHRARLAASRPRRRSRGDAARTRGAAIRVLGP